MKIALICSHGGHLTETLQLLEAFQGHEIFFVTHYSARDKDVLSIAPAYFTKNIGARPLRLLYTFLWAFPIMVREKPQVVISLGAEIAIPFFFWAKLFCIKTIFIESWCRIYGLSRTGRIVYRFVDEFWVQWPELLKACGPKARFMGAVI